MAKEWKKSRSSVRSLNDLVSMGLLHSQELGGWRAPEGESYPDPRAGEIMVFEDFFKRGIGVPVHPFLQGLLLYYDRDLQSAPELNSSYFHFYPSV